MVQKIVLAHIRYNSLQLSNNLVMSACFVLKLHANEYRNKTKSLPRVAQEEDECAVTLHLRVWYFSAEFQALKLHFKIYHSVC